MKTQSDWNRSIGREEWLRGDEFWNELEKEQAGRFDTPVQSNRSVSAVEDLLLTAGHVPNWAIAQTKNGLISSDELVETAVFAKSRGLQAL